MRGQGELMCRRHFFKFIMSKSVKDIVGKTNNDLYSEYLEFFESCGDKGWKRPISKIDFGRRISNTVGVKIKTVYRNKKTYRVYRLKEGDDLHRRSQLS